MKLVLIEWLDSHSGDGWQPLNEIKKTNRPIRCQSVGWLAADVDGHKTLVPHLSGESDEDVVSYGRGDLTIPNEAILNLSVLRQKARK